MGGASTHSDFGVIGTLLVGGKIGGLGIAYYCSLVLMGSVQIHVLCSHVAVVVSHMDPVDVSSVIFGMSWCYSWLSSLLYWLFIWAQRGVW